MLPPFRREPYNNRAATASMASLIRSRGDIEAQGALAQGNARAQMWSGIGQTVGNTMASLVEYKMDAPRREAEQLALTEAKRQASERSNLRGLEQMAGAAQMPPEQRADLLEREGYFPEAEQARAQASRRMNDVRSRIEANATIFGKGEQALREIQRDPSRYPEVRPMLVDLAASIHPDLGKEIPETYEPGQIKGLLQFAADAPADAPRKAKDLQQMDAASKRVGGLDTQLKKVAGWLAPSRSEDDWTGNLALAPSGGGAGGGLGVPGRPHLSEI